MLSGARNYPGGEVLQGLALWNSQARGRGLGMHWPFVYVPEGGTVQSHSPAEDWGVGVLSGPPLGSPHSFCMDSD